MQFTFDTTLVRGSTFSQGIRYSTLLCQSSSPVTIALGSATFAVQSGLAISVGRRVRASVISPVDDTTQFVEGPVTSYSGSALVINVDAIGGNSTYSSWQLSGAVDLTGGTFNASMRLTSVSCAGRSRTPITLAINVTGDPKTGIFTIYLPPDHTLVLGDYRYKVLFTPASSSDKFLVIGGTISVIDE